MTGVDLMTVKELLGHATLTMTMRYAHLAPDSPSESVLGVNYFFRMTASEVPKNRCFSDPCPS